MENIKLKYKNWDSVSISNWRKIKEVISDEGLEDLNRNIALLAILCDCSENDIWDLNVNELKPLMSQLDWIGSFDFPKDIKFKKINIGNVKCSIETDLQKMSIAQYVDFQNLYKDFEKNIGSVLACFIIPDGCKYGEGYDTMEFAHTIEDNLSIVQSNAICFFFLKNWANSIKGMQIFLDWEIAKMKKKNKGNQKVMEIEKKYKELMDMYGSLL